MAVQDIFQAVIEMKQDKTVELVKGELAAGTNISEILEEGLIAPMNVVGKKFSAGELFVPEMLMTAMVMKGGLEILRPHLAGTDVKPKGTVVLGTVKGDLHDIGKNLVAMIMEGAGYNVIDLGVDVDGDKFLNAAIENNADIVGLSALLTTTMSAMEEIVKKIKEAAPDKKVIIGGAPVTRQFADKIGADGYGDDAPGAVTVAGELIKAG